MVPTYRRYYVKVYIVFIYRYTYFTMLICFSYLVLTCVMLNVYSFVIKIGVGSNLVKPALMPSQTLNDERLCRLFAQKTIWVVPSIDLESQVYLVDIELIVLTKGCVL